jgi:hypothetical protein
LCRLFARLPDGLSEIYFHPGAEPEALDFTTLRNRIRREGIQLTAASAR